MSLATPDPPANVRSRKGTAGVSPASSRGVSPRVGTGGETPLELAGEDACGTPRSARPLTDHGTGTLAHAALFWRSGSPHVGGYATDFPQIQGDHRWGI